jgi:5-methylcytosine-specific restriction endonuclease McrA
MATKDEIDKVWGKGRKIPGKNQDLHRKDAHGNPIHKPSYGKNGENSWHIDHKVPIAAGGSDSLRNKQPLQAKANLQKADKYPVKPGSLKQPKK